MNVREHVVGREDRAAVLPVPGGVALVVADGAGNSGRGGQAATRLIEIVRARLAPHVDLVSLLEHADHELAATGGETTAVVVLVTADGLRGASVGDSEAWLVGDEVDVLTAGHSRKPLVGSGAAAPVAFTRRAAREALLVASDGLFKYARREAIVAAVRAGASLVDLPRLPGGAWPDDVAVLVASLG